MKKRSLIIIAVIFIFALTSCGAARSMDYAATSVPMADYSKGVNESLTYQGEVPMAALSTVDTSGGIVNAASAASTSEQMIVKNASLSILVDDPMKSLSDIMKLASDLGGFTVSSNSYQTYTNSGLQVPAASVSIRVPADKLNEALDQIKALTGDPTQYVTNESVSGQDVTQAYTDLASRLRNLEEAETELTKMYEKAEKAEDVLAIYNQKMQVSEQIEVIKGQMQYYEQASATSEISVQISAKASVQPVTIAGWQPKGVARNAVQALINFGKGFVNFLIWLVIYVLPIVLVIGAPIFFFIRWLVRRKRRAEEKLKVMPPLPTEKK